MLKLLGPYEDFVMGSELYLIYSEFCLSLNIVKVYMLDFIIFILDD
jgi:hypothetical protein